MEQENKNKINTEETIADKAMLHTYTEDLTKEVKKNQGKTYKTILEEERKKERIAEEQKPLTRKNIGFLILGIICILVAFFLFYQGSNNKKQSVFSINKTTGNFSDFTKEIDITKLTSQTLLKTINTELQSPVTTDKANSINFIKIKESLDEDGNTVTEKQKVSIKDVLFLLNVRAPEIFLRSLGNNFFFGSYGCGIESLCEKKGGVELSNQNYLVFETDFPQNTFRGAGDWEEKMLLYTYQLFNLPVTLADSALFNKPFEDVVIKNIPTRMLRDETGRTLLVYGFWGDKYMIMATDREVFSQIINRIQKTLQ